MWYLDKNIIGYKYKQDYFTYDINTKKVESNTKMTERKIENIKNNNIKILMRMWWQYHDTRFEGYIAQMAILAHHCTISPMFYDCMEGLLNEEFNVIVETIFNRLLENIDNLPQFLSNEKIYNHEVISWWWSKKSNNPGVCKLSDDWLAILSYKIRMYYDEQRDKYFRFLSPRPFETQLDKSAHKYLNLKNKFELPENIFDFILQTDAQAYEEKTTRLNKGFAKEYEKNKVFEGALKHFTITVPRNYQQYQEQDDKQRCLPSEEFVINGSIVVLCFQGKCDDDCFTVMWGRNIQGYEFRYRYYYNLSEELKKEVVKYIENIRHQYNL